MMDLVVRAKESAVLKSNFSERFYLRHYAKYEVRRRGALQHYIRSGESAGHMPTAYFDPTWWKVTHGLEEGQHPTAFEHFLIEHPDKAPSEDYDTIMRGCFRDNDELRRVIASDGVSRNGLLDFNFIAAQNAYGADAPDGLCLFLRLFGEGYRVAPSRIFDPSYYRIVNDDIAKEAIDPFSHFLKKGIFENRKPCAFLRPKSDLARFADDPDFFDHVFSPTELFELDGHFELTRGEFKSIGRTAIPHYPANLFFGEPHLLGAHDVDLMLDVYADYMEARQ